MGETLCVVQEPFNVCYKLCPALNKQFMIVNSKTSMMHMDFSLDIITSDGRVQRGLFYYINGVQNCAKIRSTVSQYENIFSTMTLYFRNSFKTILVVMEGISPTIESNTMCRFYIEVKNSTMNRTIKSRLFRIKDDTSLKEIDLWRVANKYITFSLNIEKTFMMSNQMQFCDVYLHNKIYNTVLGINENQTGCESDEFFPQFSSEDEEVLHYFLFE